MRPWHKCFLVNFVNCLRTSILLDLFIVFIVYWGAPSLLRLSHLPVIFSFSYATGLLFLLFTSLSFCHGEPIRRRQIGDNFCRPISAKRGNLSKVGKNYPIPPPPLVISRTKQVRNMIFCMGLPSLKYFLKM